MRRCWEALRDHRLSNAEYRGAVYGNGAARPEILRAARLRERGFKGLDADGVLYAPRVGDSSPRLLYVDEYGERNPSLQPDTRRALGRAVAGLWHDGRGGDRADTEKFARWAQREGLVLDPEAFAAWRRARPEIGAASEHTVYRDRASGRVVKVTHADLVGDGAVGQSPNAIDYLLGHYLGNGLLNGDVRLEGIVSGDGEFPQLVMRELPSSLPSPSSVSPTTRRSPG